MLTAELVDLAAVVGLEISHTQERLETLLLLLLPKETMVGLVMQAVFLTQIKPQVAVVVLAPLEQTELIAKAVMVE